VRHSEARQVGIILKVRDNEAICIIEDDGQGLERDRSEGSGADKKRLGLLGMRERLALVQGTLELESAPGRGATVFLRVPL
jgi:signal transduction histidine kinase